MTIDIEDDGRVYICTPDADAAMRARKYIEGIVKEIVAGEVYLGKVVRIIPIGAFVELLPGKGRHGTHHQAGSRLRGESGGCGEYRR